MNKLASIEIIKEIAAHPNADSLEIAKVYDYEAIVPLGKFSAGDDIYFQRKTETKS